MRTVIIVSVFCGLAAPFAPAAVAQPAGLDVNRDCQTIRTCNFGRGGIYRGCLSSYSCRLCRLVTAPCRIHAGQRVCQEMRCRWG